LEGKVVCNWAVGGEREAQRERLTQRERLARRGALKKACIAFPPVAPK